MAQQSFEDIAAAVKQAESGGKRYAADGKTLTTSAKGALGEMQVMPKTIRSPGFGVEPAKNKSPDEIARVGKDYLQAMLSKYGDRDKALIAYNMGPGSTDKWIAAGEKMEKLPEETRMYVQRVNRFLGSNVSRETPPAPAPAVKPREPLPPSLPPMAEAPAPAPVLAAMPVAERVAALGPGYQAALALSFLADTDDGYEEGDTTQTQEFMAQRQEEQDAAEEAALMQEQAARPAVLAELSNTKIRSPFAEPVMMAKGGEITQEEIDAANRPALFNPNIRRQGEAARKLAAMRDVNTLSDPQTYAFIQGILGETPDQLGFSVMHPDYKKIIGRGEQGMITGGVSMIGPAARALKGLAGMGVKTLKPAASAAEISKDYLQRQKAMSSGPDGAARMAVAQRNAALPIEQGGLGLPANNTAMDRAAAMGFDTDVFHGTSKDFLTFNPDKEVFAAELPEIANLYGKFRKGDGQRILPLKIRGTQLTISDMDKSGNNNLFGYNLAKKLNLSDDEIEKLLIPPVRYPSGELIPGVEKYVQIFSDQGEREIINRLPKYGIDRLKVTDMSDMGGLQTQYMLPAGSDNVRSRFAAFDPFRRTAAVAAAMGAAAPDLLAGQEQKETEVNRAEDSSDGGEARALMNSFVNRAEGGEAAPTQEEIDAASTPAFIAQKSGIGRKAGPVSQALNSGEAYIAAAKGFTNLPYNIAGAPMDIAMLLRQGLTGQAPAGQVGTSEYIKKKATEMGIRPAPPTDPTLAGFYDAGDLGSNLVNPAGATRAGVRAAGTVAQKTGEAAKMLEDVTVGNIQRGRIRRAGEQVPPDTAYDPLRERMEASGNLAYVSRPPGGYFPTSYDVDFPRSALDTSLTSLVTEIKARPGNTVEEIQKNEALMDLFNIKLKNYYTKIAGSIQDPVRNAIFSGALKFDKDTAMGDAFPSFVVKQAQKGDIDALRMLEQNYDKMLGIKSSVVTSRPFEAYRTNTEAQEIIYNSIIPNIRDNIKSIPDDQLVAYGGKVKPKEDGTMPSIQEAAIRIRKNIEENPNYFSIMLEPNIKRTISASFNNARATDVARYPGTYGPSISKSMITGDIAPPASYDSPVLPGFFRPDFEKAINQEQPILDVSNKYEAPQLFGKKIGELYKIAETLPTNTLRQTSFPDFLKTVPSLEKQAEAVKRAQAVRKKEIDNIPTLLKENKVPSKDVMTFGVRDFLKTTDDMRWVEVTDPQGVRQIAKGMDNSLASYADSTTYGTLGKGTAALKNGEVKIYSLYDKNNIPQVVAEYITDIAKIPDKLKINSIGQPSGIKPNSIAQLSGNGPLTANSASLKFGAQIADFLNKLKITPSDIRSASFNSALKSLKENNYVFVPGQGFIPSSPPVQRATGGMMERQANDNRRYL